MGCYHHTPVIFFTAKPIYIFFNNLNMCHVQAILIKTEKSCFSVSKEAVVQKYCEIWLFRKIEKLSRQKGVVDSVSQS